MIQLALQTDSDVDAMLPVVVLFGVALTRVLQTNAEARRLAMAGFSVADVLKGWRRWWVNVKRSANSCDRIPRCRRGAGARSGWRSSNS
jgi:hypothetical protein